MNRLFLNILPFVIGFATVLQAGINRKIAVNFGGLASAILLNTVILLACVSCLLLAIKSIDLGESFAIFRVKNFEWGEFKLWYVIPGILGCLILCAIPFAIQEIGALKVFVILVLGQMFASMLWDYIFEGIAITSYRLAGVLLVAIGAWLTSIRGGQ